MTRLRGIAIATIITMALLIGFSTMSVAAIENTTDLDGHVEKAGIFVNGSWLNTTLTEGTSTQTPEVRSHQMKITGINVDQNTDTFTVDASNITVPSAALVETSAGELEICVFGFGPCRSDATTAINASFEVTPGTYGGNINWGSGPDDHELYFTDQINFTIHIELYAGDEWDYANHQPSGGEFSSSTCRISPVYIQPASNFTGTLVTGQSINESDPKASNFARFSLADQNFSVPAAQGCGDLEGNNLNPIVNDALGLPTTNSAFQIDTLGEATNGTQVPSNMAVSIQNIEVGRELGFTNVTAQITNNGAETQSEVVRLEANGFGYAYGNADNPLDSVGYAEVEDLAPGNSTTVNLFYYAFPSAGTHDLTVYTQSSSATQSVSITDIPTLETLMWNNYQRCDDQTSSGCGDYGHEVRLWITQDGGTGWNSYDYHYNGTEYRCEDDGTYACNITEIGSFRDIVNTGLTGEQAWGTTEVSEWNIVGINNSTTQQDAYFEVKVYDGSGNVAQCEAMYNHSHVSVGTLKLDGMKTCQPSSFQTHIVDGEVPGTVSEGTVVEVPVDVVNAGENDTKTITLSANGTQVDSTTLEMRELRRGSYDHQQPTLVWNTSGYSGTVTVTAASPDDSDSTTVNVTTSSGGGGPFFDVSITGTNSPVVEGNTLDVSANITNTGDASDTQTVDLLINGTVEDSQSISLGAGATNLTTFNWATVAGDAGTYNATVASDNSSASTTVQVNAPAFFNVTITGTNSPVTEGNDLTVNADITNTGDVTQTQTVTLTINGTQEDSQSITLSGGQTNSTTFTWTTVSGDAGNYTAAVNSANDTDSTAVSVTSVPQPANFSVAIVNTYGVHEGENIVVESNVTNIGDQAGTQTVALAVDGVQEDSQSLSLNASETTLLNLTWSPTIGDGAQTYTLNVSSDNSSSTQAFDLMLNPIVTDPPLDLNADNLYEDIDGNNLSDANDVQSFFDNYRGHATVNAHPSLFDFNNDTGITIGDVQALWVDIVQGGGGGGGGSPPSFDTLITTVENVNNPGRVRNVSYNFTTNNTNWNNVTLEALDSADNTTVEASQNVSADGFYSQDPNHADITVRVYFSDPAGTECWQANLQNTVGDSASLANWEFDSCGL